MPWPGPPPVPPRPAPPGRIRPATPHAAYQSLPADLRGQPPCRDRITNPGCWLAKSALWLSGTLRPECMARVPPVNSVEHIGELRRRDRDRPLGWRRPDKATALQPLRIERHANPVMPDDLDQVASGAAKNVQIADVRVAAKGLLHLQRQPVHAFAHVGPADRQPDPHPRGNRDHRRSRTSSTSRSVEAWAPSPTRTR